MRPLNLIPPEDRRGDSAPLRAGVASYAIVGVLAFALIALVALVLTSNKINDNNSKLASLQARQAAADQAAAGLAPYNDFATLASTRNQTVTSLAQSRFDWERVLRELALVIPADVTLDDLAAHAAPEAAADGSTAAGGEITGPSLDLTGCAQGQEGVAELLAALRDIDGVTRVGMQSSALQTESADSAAAESPDSAGGSNASADACQRSGVASFSITVAFDAVPTAAAPTTDSAAVPTVATAAPTTTTPTADTSSAAADGGVAQAQSQENQANASAAEQSGRARNAANAVGGTQ